MAFPVIESYTKNSTNGTASSITLTKPSNVIAGDLLLIFVGNENSADGEGFADDLSGWTRDYNHGGASVDCYIGCYWRIATGTEGLSETVNFLGNDDGHGWYLRISGVDTENPINASGAPQGGVHTSVHGGSCTTTVENTLVLCHVALDGSDGDPFELSSSNGHTMVDYNESPNPSSSGNASSGAFAKRDFSGTGTTGSLYWLFQTSDGAVASAIAIAPSSDTSVTVSPSVLPLTIDTNTPLIETAGGVLIEPGAINFDIVLGTAIVPTVTFLTQLIPVDLTLVGPSIEIGLTPPPVDAHTLDILGDGSGKHLWHFDDSNINDVGTSTITEAGTHTFPNGRYGKGCKTSSISETSFSDMSSPIMTICGWGYLDTDFTRKVMYFKHGTGTLDRIGVELSDENVRVNIPNGGSNYTVDFTNYYVKRDQWLWVCVVFTSTRTYVYVNNHASTTSSSIVNDQIINEMWLYNYSGITRDNIRIFNKALSYDERAFVMNEDATPEIEGGVILTPLTFELKLKSPNIVHHADFDDTMVSFNFSQEIGMISKRRNISLLQEIEQLPNNLFIERTRI